MPHTFIRKFRVRYYECDFRGQVTAAHHLRYMQETAFDASTSAGFDFERYNAIKRLWLIRESGIKFVEPLRYNDVVAVKTWVADFRRVSSRRVYEFYRLPSSDPADINLDQGQRIASAYTDWAFMDTNHNRPAIITEDLIAGFYPEGTPDTFPVREPFPKAPAPPEDVFTTRIEVAFNHIDGMQHVNNSIYLDYVTECENRVNLYYGWSWESMIIAGLNSLLKECRIQYIKPAQIADTLEISTWAHNIMQSSAERSYLIRRSSDGELLARVHTRSIWFDLNTGQPTNIPVNYIDALKPNIINS